MTVSVFIATRDRPDALRRCLRSVAAQSYPDVEVLVLDNAGSPALSARTLQDLLPERPVRLLRRERPLGVGAARNLLMQAASGDILLALDDDAYFRAPDTLDRVVDVFRTHTGVGICALRIEDHRNGRIRLLIPHSRRDRRRHPHLADVGHQVSYYLGGAHAIRRSVIDACGVYSAHLEYGEEELDLSYRAIQAGFALYYLPDAVVVHEAAVHRQPDPQVFRRRLYHHVRNRLYLAYRYLPALYVPSYLTWWLLAYALEAVRRRAPGAYLSGLTHGLAALRQVRRSPLDARALAYLRKHYGRLWY